MAKKRPLWVSIAILTPAVLFVGFGCIGLILEIAKNGLFGVTDPRLYAAPVVLGSIIFLIVRIVSSHRNSNLATTGENSKSTEVPGEQVKTGLPREDNPK